MSLRGTSTFVWTSLIAVGLAGCGPSVRSEPATGKPVRIASLTLATDEILQELVSPDRVVAVTALADDPGISNVAGRYPSGIRRLRIENPEQVIALAPDLICVASYNSADSLELLRRSGLPLYRNESVSSIDEIETGVERLAERLGEPERGRSIVGRMRVRRRDLASKLREVARRPRVLFWSAGFTSGRRSTIDDVIREGGGTNVATELDLEGSTEIAPERVVAADPEVILVSVWEADDRQGQIANHPILRRLRAVREGRVVAIESRYLTSVSQYVVKGAERLAHALHPDKFADGAAP